MGEPGEALGGGARCREIEDADDHDRPHRSQQRDHHAQPLAARHGLVAAGHETAHGTHARVHQFSLVYLFHCASEFYTCPLAMTDGAATALKASGNQRLNKSTGPLLESPYLRRSPLRENKRIDGLLRTKF